MRLKKLIMQGFKSFADRTEFVFDSPITGIVGPNGCGKSNVVDGFKWVLGEQSAKSLRGDAMLDVIFNGSGGRKPAGMAEVVLVFDNPPKDDGARTLALDADEVAVGRRLFRDGASEYQVNGRTARLKDIRELFLDTGVGVDAYSVIEQGRVAALLEANPAERRLIFEEAAGISKYKAKKKEAQRKLERTEQNLLRAADIVEEVEKQLRSVKLQAGRARTFQEHSQKLRELRLGYALHEYHTLHAEFTQVDAAESQARGERQDAATELAYAQQSLAERRAAHEEASQEKQRRDYALVQRQAEIGAARQKAQYARQQIEQSAQQLQALAEDQAAALEKAQSAAESLIEESAALSSLAASLEERRSGIESMQQACADNQRRHNDAVRQIERHKSAILEAMREASAVNNRIGKIEIERKNISQQHARAQERQAAVTQQLASLAAEQAGWEGQLSHTRGHLADLQSRLEAASQQAAALGRQIAQTAERIGAAREHRSGLLSRQKLLSDLEARREGVSEGVKAVLRERDDRFPFIRGLVADLLRVDIEHAAVIEAALDGKDQFLVTHTQLLALAAAPALQELEGRVNILCLDRLDGAASGESAPAAPDDAPGFLSPQFSPQWSDSAPLNPDASLEPPLWPQRPIAHADTVAASAADAAIFISLVTDPGDADWNLHGRLVRRAIDLVRFEPADAPLARHLLGRTIVCETLEDAAALHRQGPPGWRFATLAGEVVEADGALRAGPLAASMGILSRRSELEALTLQIADVDARIEGLSHSLSSSNEQSSALQQSLNELRNQQDALNSTRVDLATRLAQNADRQSHLSRELPLLEREMANFAEQMARLAPEEAQLIAQREAVEARHAEHESQAAALAGLLDELAQQLRAASEALTAARVELGEVQQRQLAAQQTVRRLEAASAESRQQLARIEAAMAQTASRAGALEADLAAAEAEHAAAEESAAELAEQVERLASQVEALAAQVREDDHAAQRLGARAAQADAAAHKLEMQLSELRVRLETCSARTLEELQIDVVARYQEVQDAGGYEPGDIDWESVSAQIRELKERIARLGNVNLDAIDELAQLEEREQFLTGQVRDLNESRAQLSELIDTINAESSVRFEQTFNAVREHFQDLFRKLFGGGKADVCLETEIDERVKSTDEAGVVTTQIVRRKVDVLDAGIEVIARPPGKQPVSISQLSGGEKTMTCVALLLSIFKSKPSPFCILDEVDAALDEANNQRFNLIVQEFLAQSQFIIITHSKRTMQIADLLYGVTMQEQGVSKRVSVRFDQVDAKGRIDSAAVDQAREEDEAEAETAAA